MSIINHFKIELEQKGKTNNTIKAYISDIEKFKKWLKETYDEKFSPQNITTPDIVDYKSYLLNVKKRKASTVNRRLASLSAFINWCETENLINSNPIKDIEIIKEVQTAPKALNELELKRLIREAYKDNHVRNIAIIEVLANTGLRVGELVSLTLDDISISPRKGHLTVREGKRDNYREIPLNKNVRKALTNYLEERPDSSSDKVFLGQRGPLKKSAIWRIVKKYADRAEVEASPHTLRHTFATRLLRDHDMDIITVSKLLGHSSVDSTAIYTQPSQKDLEKAVDELTE